MRIENFTNDKDFYKGSILEDLNIKIHKKTNKLHLAY